MMNLCHSAVLTGRRARALVAWAVISAAKGAGCFPPWVLVPAGWVHIVTGPLVTMYPSLRHWLLLVASKGRRGVNSWPSLPGLDTCRQSRVPEGCRLATPGLLPASLRGTPPAGESAPTSRGPILGAIRSGGFRLRGNESGTKVALVQSDQSGRGCLSTVVQGLLVRGPGRRPGRSESEPSRSLSPSQACGAERSAGLMPGSAGSPSHGRWEKRPGR